MCPAVAKTSDEEIVAVAGRLVEEHGAEGVTMQAVAEAVGIRAPSLYKRFADRFSLLAAVERAAFFQLERALAPGARAVTPEAKLEAMGRAYRSFARAHPRLYGLLFSGTLPHDDAGTEARRRVATPAVEAFSALLGSELSLPAARAFTAFLHGFVSMEIAQEFRLGAGVDEAFELGVRTLVRGVTPSALARSPGETPRRAVRPTPPARGRR